jgi:hypothetical protein
MTVKSEPNPVESPPLAPAQIHSKVGAAAIAGSFSVLVIYGLSLAGVDVPPEPAVAIGTLLSFIAGYIAKS